jgi:hypothetical protein
MGEIVRRLIKPLDAGKRRGYDAIQEVDGVSFLFEFALKKQNESFETYFFSIEELKIDQADEDGEEEIKQFSIIESALENLRSHGAELDRLTAIKCSIPF